MSEGKFEIKKSTLKRCFGFLIVVLAVVAVFNFMDGKWTTGKVVDEPIVPAIVSASADDDPRWGSAEARVEIIEFSDFQCPHCSRAAETVKQIKEEYGKDVTIVFRDLPLTSIHPESANAAVAAECMQEIGGDKVFWLYHDKVFANQNEMSQENLKRWATELGVDITNCLKSGKLADEYVKDTQDAQAAGAQGAPYFVINGKPLSGAQPIEEFRKIIDAELA